MIVDSNGYSNDNNNIQFIFNDNWSSNNEQNKQLNVRLRIEC